MPARAVACIAAVLGVALTAASCGSSAGRSSSTPGSAPTPGSASTAGSARSGRLPRAFAWLNGPRPGPRWPMGSLPSGDASIRYPPSWKRVKTDRGTFTVVLQRGTRFLGYLNLTPQQGGETLANYPRFRVSHNREEGTHSVHTLAAAERLPFGTARGSCVIDRYLSKVGSHPYREIACLVSGRRAQTVVVGAAAPALWSSLGALVQRAVASTTER